MIRRGVDPGWLGSLPLLKILGGGQSIFDPPKMSHSFIQNCFWITLQVLHHEDLRQKLTVKLIFRGA